MKSMGRIFGFLMAALMLAAFALPATADVDKKQFRVAMSVPPGQTTPPFTVLAKITNESILPLQSLNLFVSGVTIVGVKNAVDTFQLLPHLSLPLPQFAKLALTGSSISITKDPMVWGETLTLTILVNSCGDSQWNAAAWLGLQLNGQSFNLDPSSILTASIPCGPPLAAGATFVVPDSLNANCVTGQRDYYDKDGTIPGGSLSIFVTNTVSTNGQVHFRWSQDITGDPAAAFDYSVCGSGNLPLPQSTLVAWLNQDGTLSSQPGNPAYIPAQQCVQPSDPAPALASMLPVPYGTLVSVSAVTADTATLTVDALHPTGLHGAIQHGNPPFDIVVGTERMTVTDVASDDGETGDLSDSTECSDEDCTGEVEIWTVTRHVGGTPSTNLTQPIPPNTLVMYTPLPLLPLAPTFADTSLLKCFTADGILLNASSCHYVAGNQAQMCIVEQVNSGTGHVTEFIDIGDGWGNHP